MKENIKNIYLKIHNHPTYKHLMSSNDDVTIDDGINLLTLLSVVHDELEDLI